MSSTSPAPTIAYLAQGKVRLKIGTAAPRTLESAYGNSIREKEIRAQQKHSWKSGGGGSPFGGPVLWGKSSMQQDVPLAITSICGGKEKGGLLYSMESGSLCALLEAGELGADERRLWNDNRTRIRHLSISRQTGDLAFGVLHENGTANIGLRLHGESGVKELTEGDSFDTAPHWVPGEGRKLVFQSAGIGRNREGHFLALGAFSIQQLDIEAGDMTTLLEEQKYDHLAPQFLEDGTLLYIRRPYTLNEGMHPLRTMKDFFLFPFRLLFAVFQFLNFFSKLFTGRQLTTDGGAKAREMNMRQMMIWGNLVNAQRPARPEEEGVDLIPKSWELHQRSPDGKTKVLATGVLAYDVAPDGLIVYTNGNALFLLHPDGRKERLFNESMIEQVFFVPE
ncbi:MAG TPA: hypothetical protein VG754_02915 [Verrucomicrobiae bacterium]|nr:hypothetical protein [Verrucomicrobiae bacterium]